MFNLATRELPSLVTSGLSLHFSPNGGRLLAGGSGASVWIIARCIWNGQFETDAVSRFNRTAVLTHGPLEIRLGPRSYS